MSNILNLVIQQGEDLQKLLSISTTVNNITTPTNLTNYSFAGQIREKYTDINAVANFAFTIQNQNTNTGEVIMALANNALSSLILFRNKNYVYDIEMTDSSNKKTTIMKGIATIAPEVTK